MGLLFMKIFKGKLLLAGNMNLITKNGQALTTKQPKLTNGLILDYHRQLERMRLSSDVNYYLKRVEIDLFYQKYEKRLFDLNKQIIELRKKYFEHDENGKPVYEEKTETNLKPKVKVREGLTREGYQVESNELMGKEI